MGTLIKRITAACTAAVLLSLSISVTAAEGQKPVYDVDDKGYMAKVDGLYGSIPLESLVLEALDDMVNSNNRSYLSKWFYKHVYVNAPEVKIDIRPSESKIPDEVPFMASSVFLGEQGRGDSIEEEDGKVRKFNDITVNWNIVTSKKAQSAENISAFLREKGYDVSALQADTSGKRFYLIIDETITKEQMLDTVEALNLRFGILPDVFGYEKGRYTLYHDPDYTGYNLEDEYDTSQKYYNDDANITVFKREHPLLKNKGTFESGVTYEYNPETKTAVVTGEGTVTFEEGQMLWETFAQFRPADVIVIGRDVNFETTREYYKRAHPEYADNVNDGVSAVWYLTRANFNEFLYVYRDSYADKADKRNMNNNTDDVWHCINYIGDDIDPYDVLSGKVILTPENDKSAFKEHVRQIEEQVEREMKDIWGEEEQTEASEPTAVPETSETPSETKVAEHRATLKGDADVNGTVDLADLTTVAKYTLSSSSYPLKNDTAYANADMNGDGKVDGLDISALIEDQLGRR